MDSSDNESEQENLDTIKEAIDTQFINDSMFKNYKPKDRNRKKIVESKLPSLRKNVLAEDESFNFYRVSRGFQTFIARKLSEKLEQELQGLLVANLTPLRCLREPEGGVRLLRSSAKYLKASKSQSSKIEKDENVSRGDIVCLKVCDMEGGRRRNVVEEDGRRNVVEEDGRRNIVEEDGRRNVVEEDGRRNVVEEDGRRRNVVEEDESYNFFKVGEDLQDRLVKFLFEVLEEQIKLEVVPHGSTSVIESNVGGVKLLKGSVGFLEEFGVGEGSVKVRRKRRCLETDEDLESRCKSVAVESEDVLSGKEVKHWSNRSKAEVFLYRKKKGKFVLVEPKFVPIKY